MDYFNLPLSRRLALAFASGSSVWAVMLFPKMVDELAWLPYLPLAPVALFFAMLVLVPFISTATFRGARALALIFTAISVQTLVIVLSVDFPNYLGLGDLEVILNVMLGSLLICIATGVVAPVKMSPKYLAYAAGAGLAAGVAFYFILNHAWTVFCFDPCPWWNDLVFAAGWISWHMSVCAAIYLGSNGKPGIEPG